MIPNRTTGAVSFLPDHGLLWFLVLFQRRWRADEPLGPKGYRPRENASFTIAGMLVPPMRQVRGLFPGVVFRRFQVCWASAAFVQVAVNLLAMRSRRTDDY